MKKCLICGHDWKPADGTQGLICDVCRDEDSHAIDRARMIEAVGDPFVDVLERDLDRLAVERMQENDNDW